MSSYITGDDVMREPTLSIQAGCSNLPGPGPVALEVLWLLPLKQGQLGNMSFCEQDDDNKAIMMKDAITVFIVSENCFIRSSLLINFQNHYNKYCLFMPEVASIIDKITSGITEIALNHMF
jgi:hypothetical protein